MSEIFSGPAPPRREEWCHQQAPVDLNLCQHNERGGVWDDEAASTTPMRNRIMTNRTDVLPARCDRGAGRRARKADPVRTPGAVRRVRSTRSCAIEAAV